MDRNCLGLSTALFNESSREDWLEAREAGFRIAELSANLGVCGLSAEEWIAVTEKRLQGIREAGMELWTVHIPYGPLWDPSQTDQEARNKACRWIETAIHAAAHWGAKGAVLHGSFEPIPLEAEKRGEHLRAAAQAVEYLAEEAAKSGIFLAVENLPRTCLGNCSGEILEIIGKSQAGICFDVNHLLQEDHQSFLKAAGSRIRTVHLSDYDFRDECHWLPGDGKIRWAELIDGLESVGYNGPLLFEISCRRLKGVRPLQVVEKFRQACR